MPLSRFIAIVGIAFAVGIGLGGGRWVTRPLVVCWSMASHRADDDLETAGSAAGKLSRAEIETRFPIRLAPAVKEPLPEASFDSAEWAGREAKRRCGLLALALAICVGGFFGGARWVAKQEVAA